MSSLSAARVEVPASSANLGPGFDALAVALDVKLTVVAIPREQRRVVAEGDGAGELPGDESNLIWRSLVAYCDWCGADVPDVSLRTRSDIPLERGMGSSAAAAVAGVAMAHALTGTQACDDDLVRLAAELEGHTDNAAAAVLGGLVVVLDGVPRRLDPSPALRPVVCIPSARQSTGEARGVLPQSVSLRDAAANGARTAVTLAGLSGMMAFEPAAMTDALHEPARFGIMTRSGALAAALRGEGIGACLSGAGPTVLAVVAADDDAVMARISDIAGADFTVRPVHWDLAGATVTWPEG